MRERVCYLSGRRAFVALVVAVLANAPSARAGGTFEKLEKFPELVLTGSVLMALGGTATALGNAIPAIRGERPSRAWQIAGWVVGVLNVLEGGIWLWLGTGIRSAMVTGSGAALLAIGVAGLGLTIYGATRPRPTRVPMIKPVVSTHAGYPFLGVSFTFSHR